MATRHLCLYRNKAIGTSRTAAKTALETALGSANDGEIVINRYKDGDNIKVLIGFTTEDSTVKKPFIFDADAIPADVQKELDKIGGTGEGSLKNAIDEAKNDLIGSPEDTSDSQTITGAKKYTDSKIADLNLTDNAVAKSFVTKVNQNNGKITVARGEVTSKDKTVKMTDGADGGFDVAVNIDGTTIIKNESSGVLSVASGALTQYKGSNAVKVSEVDQENNKTVSLSINSNDKVLTQSNDGLFANINLTWDKTKGLKLIGKDAAVIATIPATDFIKDGMLENATYDEETHKITLTFNPDSEKAPIELNLSNLVYEAGNGLELTGNVFSVKKSTEEDSEGFLKVGTDGVKVSGIQEAINKASNNINEKSTGRVTVTSNVEADGHTTYTIAEDDIAQATVLTGEIERAKAAELKINQGVGLNDDGSHKTTTGNYTAAATTIAGEISALDAQVHTNATNIANYKDTIDNYTIGGAKISTNPVLTGENGVTVSGLTISLNLATDGNLEIGSNGLKLADTIDCGTYE